MERNERRAMTDSANNYCVYSLHISSCTLQWDSEHSSSIIYTSHLISLITNKSNSTKKKSTTILQCCCLCAVAGY